MYTLYIHVRMYMYTYLYSNVTCASIIVHVYVVKEVASFQEAQSMNGHGV